MAIRDASIQPSFGITTSPQSDVCRTPLSTSSSGSNSFDIPSTPKVQKPLHEYNLQDCCDFLHSIELDEYIPIFVQNKMDGILMSCFAREQIGSQILSNMGITDRTRIDILVKAVNKLNSY